MMQQIYLTRRNLLTLLSKLDRAKVGEITSRTICKCDYDHPKFPFSFKDYVNVTAVEDDDYYTKREPGVVHLSDEPKE